MFRLVFWKTLSMTMGFVLDQDRWSILLFPIPWKLVLGFASQCLPSDIHVGNVRNILVEHQSRYLLSIPFCCDKAKACAQHFCARHPLQSEVTSPVTPLMETWWGWSAEKHPTKNHWVVPFKGPSKTCSLWKILLALPIIPCQVKAGRPGGLGSSSSTSISWCLCSVSCGCELVCSILVSDVDVDEDFLLELMELPE